MRYDFITQLVGNTPCIRFLVPELVNTRIWIKMEGSNPTASVKDRACIANIRGAEKTGRLKPGQELLDASSGNMACSLAYFGAILGHPVRVVCSSKLTQDKKDFIKYFGAELEVIGDFTIEGNLYCRSVLQPQKPDQICFLDQLHNWDNPKAHYETTGPEIIQDFPHVTAIVGSLGSGGTMHGVARYIKAMSPQTKIITVESARGTKIPGTGSFLDGDYITPFINDLAERGWVDYSMRVELEAAQIQTIALRQQGFFIGFQTGGVVSSAIQCALNHDLSGDIICISGDSGWKNMEKLKKLCVPT